MKCEIVNQNRNSDSSEGGIMNANDYSLNPGRYIEIVEKPIDNVDFEARMKELMGEFAALTAAAHKLEKKIKNDWGKIL